MKAEPSFRPLDKRRYFEQVAEAVRERIGREHLEEGHRLPSEQQLAAELGVSRPVIREGLRILDVMGHIDIRRGPQGGIFVSSHYHKPLSASLMHLATNGRISVDHLFDVRLQIEPFIAVEAAHHAKKSDLKRLSALIDDASRHLDDAAYLKACNIEFHLLLADASGNPVLSIIMRAITDILLQLAYNFLDHSFERELFAIHRELFGAIAAQRADDVRRMIGNDIRFVKRHLKGSLEKDSTGKKGEPVRKNA